MVDSIRGSEPGLIRESSLQQTGAQERVEQVNQNAAKDAGNVGSLSTIDNATISDEARAAYEQEKEILKFSRLAMRVKETMNMDKVSKLKDMVNSGKINDYLNSLDNNSIADAILQSPSGAFLR